MSSPQSEALEEAPDTTRNGRSRRSGRVSRKPDLYIEEAPTTSKRKRDAADDDQEDENDDQDDSEEEDESEPDEEELREQKAKARKTRAAAPKKPAVKRPKTNGTSVALPVRAGGKKGRSKKAKEANEAAAQQVGGLYGWLSRIHTLCMHSLTIPLQPTSLFETRHWKKWLPNGSSLSINMNHAP
jgi:cohesin complex subunit SA-1/2